MGSEELIMLRLPGIIKVILLMKKENKIFRNIIRPHETLRFREMIEIYDLQKGGNK